MENEKKTATIKLIDDGKTLKEVSVALVWGATHTLLAEIANYVVIPKEIKFQILSERWTSSTIILGVELSFTKYSVWGADRKFRRVMLKPKVDKEHLSSSIDIGAIRAKVNELMPAVAEEIGRKAQDEQHRKAQDEKHKLNAPLLTLLAQKYGWELKGSGSDYDPDSISISLQTSTGKVTIKNHYGDLEVSVKLKDSSPKTVEEFVKSI